MLTNTAESDRKVALGGCFVRNCKAFNMILCKKIVNGAADTFGNKR